MAPAGNTRRFAGWLLTLAAFLMTGQPSVLFAANPIVVGSGAPTAEITSLFQLAFYRNNFNNLVLLPPVGNVRALGTGLVQEFYVAATYNKSNVANPMMALIMPDQNAPASNTAVVQMASDVYTYYSTLSPITVGLPTTDTQSCSGTTTPCTYNILNKSAAIFAYAAPLINGQYFIIQNPEFTQWQTQGGVAGPAGYPISASTSITSGVSTVTSTEQLFTNGAFFNITSGTYSGQSLAVVGPIWNTYTGDLGPKGPLGLPTSQETVLPGGVHQQLFEGGTIQYTPGSTPVILLPVTSVRVLGPGNFTTAITINLSDSATLTAQAFGAGGGAVTGRPVTWSVTNLNVVSIAPNGSTATIKGIGGGTAYVTATVGGVSSTPLAVTVIAPCCAVGDGAPSVTKNAFQAALSRNQLTAVTPEPSPTVRIGQGYVQMLNVAGSTQAVMVAQADGSPLAYVVSGAILNTYQAAGGPAGPTGYPTTDPTTGGRQMFANTEAIAGNPAFVVFGQILTKWTVLGYETGVIGLPVSASSAFTTALGATGFQQNFSGGSIIAVTSGTHREETHVVSGLILARYTALGGPAGTYGLPISDETVTGQVHTQTFEFGYINYTVGDSAAVDHPNPRTPAISANPPSVAPGGRLTLAVLGFSNGASVKVTVGSQPDFTVTVPNGIFSWTYVVPSNAVVGTIKIHAIDTSSGATADGSFAIQSTASIGAKLTIVQGNSQSGGPGALLPLPLKIAMKDSTGAPITNVPVTFVPSPGAVISAYSAVTDINGNASTNLRLPATTGVAEVIVQAMGQYVTFGATAVSTPALNIPAMTATSTNILGNGTAQISQKGATLTASAMILRYLQNQSLIGQVNGLADPDTLNKYLLNCGTGCDGYLTNPDTGEQVVNLWRLAGFSGGMTDIVVDKSDTVSIQDHVADGTPELVFLSLAANGLPVGGTAVVVMGVANDGSLTILDPNPVLARTSMNDYLNGFTAANVTWRGTIVSAARIVMASPSTGSFVLGAISQPTSGGGVALDAESPQGPCGPVLEVPDAAVIGSVAGVTLRSSRFAYCAGNQPGYQLTTSAPGSYRAYVEGGGINQDLSGTKPSAWSATISKGALTVVPQTAAFTSNAILNAASFVAGISPGGLYSLFGSGLFGAAADTTVTFGNEASTLLLKSPFQLNGQVPADLVPGSYSVTVTSAWGTSTQTVNVSQAAPGIFIAAVESGNRQVGAVINQDGTLNDLSTPARRGDVMTVYCTDLGAVQTQGILSVTVSTTTALLNSAELPVQYAGLTPGFIGLYQVNVSVPGGTTPGSNISLAIKVNGSVSNAVSVAIQ